MKNRTVFEWRKYIIGVVGVCLIGASVYILNIYIAQKEANQMTMQTIKPIRLLQSGEVITPDMLRLVTISEAAHSSEGILEASGLIGKTVVVPISENEEIFGWKLTDSKTVPSEGERYYSFKTDAIANVNNMVRKGDRVDVWIEFDVSKQIKSTSGNLNVSAIKIIEGLPVASVRTVEGIEVVDASALDLVLQNDTTQLNGARGKSSGVGTANTYIMSDSIYAAYVSGVATGGRIKLALPNLTSKEVPETKVTSLFSQLMGTDAFKADSLQVNGTVKASDVTTSTGTQPKN